MENIYESEYAKVEYIPKDHVVFHTWKKYCHLEDYRKPVRFSVELLYKYPGSDFVVDARNGFEDDKEDVAGGFDEFLPNMKKTACKNWVFILNEVSDVEGEIDMWTNEIQKYFHVIRVTSYQQAITELRKNRTENA